MKFIESHDFIIENLTQLLKLINQIQSANKNHLGVRMFEKEKTL